MAAGTARRQPAPLPRRLRRIGTPLAARSLAFAGLEITRAQGSRGPRRVYRSVRQCLAAAVADCESFGRLWSPIMRQGAASAGWQPPVDQGENLGPCHSSTDARTPVGLQSPPPPPAPPCPVCVPA